MRNGRLSRLARKHLGLPKPSLFLRYFCNNLRYWQNSCNFVGEPKHTDHFYIFMQTPENDREGLPPFIKSWAQMYRIVIGTLFALILFFYWMMRYLA